MSLHGYPGSPESLETLHATASQLVQLAVEKLRSGTKKVKFEVEVEAKLSDDGKSVELEVEVETKEGSHQEKREYEYNMPL